MGSCCSCFNEEEFNCDYCNKKINEIYLDVEFNSFCSEYCKCMYRLHKNKNLIIKY